MSDYDQFESFDEPQPQYSDDDDGKKVNVWVIVGIIIAVVVLIAIAIGVGIVIHKNKQQPKQTGGFRRFAALEETGARIPRKPTFSSLSMSSDSVYDNSLNSNNAQYSDLPYKTEQYNIL